VIGILNEAGAAMPPTGIGTVRVQNDHMAGRYLAGALPCWPVLQNGWCCCRDIARFTLTRARVIPGRDHPDPLDFDLIKLDAGLREHLMLSVKARGWQCDYDQHLESDNLLPGLPSLLGSNGCRRVIWASVSRNRLPILQSRRPA
jgi:hypothetical protein